MSDQQQLTVLEEFKRYAYFSVRVDRYFSVVNIYGMHHAGIKEMYSALPSRAQMDNALASPADEALKRFLTVSATALGHMATTNIFNDEGEQAGGAISDDAMNFAFYTCYCFQWSLFEDFVKIMIRKVIDAGAMQAGVVRDLESKWRQTKQFFDKINSGAVFGRTPFTALLPVMGWMPSVEEVGYDQLNEIRELRNNFIHGVESPEITSEDIMAKQRRYHRSMWILRKFAENVQWEVQRALGSWNG
ncbi:MAG: hypothetical protein LW850_27480 [Planctomycetaceae bacterium]|jgi:hypothetical protein|nr:hypothetical protein [Planctomycetaceae bacterium]